MPASIETIHEGGECFMNRAMHFAAREIGERPRLVPVPASWLGLYLAYRSGMSLEMIAALMDVEREHVSRRTMAVMALMGVPAIRERIEALVAENGQVNFEIHQDNVLRFPGPNRLAPNRHVVEVA